ncbi:MAG: hypothetical protein ACTMKW_08530, partial [Brevibacterium aurantiacum]
IGVDIARSSRKVIGLTFAAALAAGGLVVASDDAWAVSNCSAYKQDHPSDSSARVVAYSTNLDANKKARGELVRSAFVPNAYTSWFTDDSGKRYYSPYRSFAVDTACEIANV